MKKTILATAYAVNPYKGSEDGMGWNFILQIARFQKVVAVTRENNQANIEKYMQENPSFLYENIQFLYFDLPYWMRFWKKGGRGAMLYYWMWQMAMPNFIKKQNLTFDIAHNLNFHNDWTPSYLWKLGKPFVWGSIGHHSLIPKQYLKPYALHFYIKDRLAWGVKQFFWRFSPALKSTIRHADHILCMNSDVANRLDLSGKEFSIMPSVATQNVDFERIITKNNNTFRLISIGRFVPLKGFDLTIEAFAQFLKKLSPEQVQKCELLLIGTGETELFLRETIKKLAIESNVKIIQWMNRTDLLEQYKTVDAFLFPSHEGAGMVVAEAMSFGLPIICLDNDGAGEFIDENCGIPVKIQDYENTVIALSEAIFMLYQHPDLCQKMGKNAQKRFETHFHWDNRGDFLKNIYVHTHSRTYHA